VCSALFALLLTGLTYAADYSYSTPSGWQAALADGMEIFTPGQEPEGTAQVMLLPAKPLQGDFASQFLAERQVLENSWGLTAPQPATSQAGNYGGAQYAAYYASFDSAGGERYMAFMATGQNGRLGLLVVVTASAEGFNRVAPQAARLLQGLRIP
jgi:hypothetical protein